MPVALLASFEMKVMDEDTSEYSMVYAWTRLLKYWASLRYDDMQWINPGSMVMSFRQQD